MDAEKILNAIRPLYAGQPLPSMTEIEAAMREQVDSETKGIMIGYAGRLLWDRRRTTVETLDLGCGEWSPDDFQEMIGDAIERIPPDLRQGATVDLAGDYDDRTALCISYRRPETEEEFAIRIASALMYARAQQASEIVTYERLKRKFESPSGSAHPLIREDRPE
jgi:hypothetical protein